MRVKKMDFILNFRKIFLIPYFQCKNALQYSNNQSKSTMNTIEFTFKNKMQKIVQQYMKYHYKNKNHPLLVIHKINYKPCCTVIVKK